MLIKIIGDDMWDPNNWVPDDHEFRIYYSDTDPSKYVIVDEIDYHYLIQFKWSRRTQRGKDEGLVYLKRGISEFYGECTRTAWYISEITGRPTRARNRVQSAEYLHIAVLKRSGQQPPTPKHREADHINRKTWDCRRCNLRWATRAEQIANSNAKQKGKPYVRTPNRLAHTDTAGEAGA